MLACIETSRLFSVNQQTTLTVRVRAATALVEAEPAAAVSDLESTWAEMDRVLSAN